jgi:demethylmenaquinone methyltransferase/2-methoxy-6-polyprenyl-1,4-benzoquinol methylase
VISENPKDLVPQFFNDTSDSYDNIVHWTTFGKDSLWKNKILEQLSGEKTVLDLACGTGILTRQIAQKIPHAEIVGVDITSTYLEKAKEKLESYPNISFVNSDAEKLKLDRKFDCITASYLPKYCDSEILIKTCLEHLNPGGKIILHDFTYPKNRFVRQMWNVYFKVLNFEGFFIPSWKNVFVDLPQLIRTSKWVEKYQKSMKNAGLKTNLEELTWGCSAVLTGTKVL